MDEFSFNTTPYPHQLEGFRLSKDAPFFAYLMEQRTGKTKLTIDVSGYNYLAGRINGLAVVAPNGVHTNWAKEEIPLHMSEEVPTMTLVWRSSRSGTKEFQALCERLLAFRGLAILCMNIEATITPRGKAFLKKFLTRRRVLIAVDESTDIKTPGAKRTKSLKALGRLARMRRILTGTPGKPMDLYSQYGFLSPHILGTSFAAHKAEYGVWEQRRNGDGRTFEVLTGHRNVDKLRQILLPHSFRVTRAEAFPNMPSKLYSKHFIELTREQERMYRELRTSFITEFADGASVTAAETLVRLLRLQQIASGYVPVDKGFLEVGAQGYDLDAQPERMIPGTNPRLEALLDILSRADGKVIVWCRFRLDVSLILAQLGDAAVRFVGGMKDEERERNKAAFQKGSAQFLVANARAAGRGLDFSAADQVVYYSNYFGLETRQQSEDRAQHPSRKKSVLYTDIVAEGTVDEKIIKALRSDQELADLITGDPSKDWI